jgi:hypothetical protein
MPLNSVLQSLFSTALGRAVPIIYQKIVRRSKVDAAMRGQSFENSAIRQAITDYEVIVGSTYGTLTESLDKFLRQLESSGIIVTMAEEAVVHKRAKITRQAFCCLHAEVFGSAAGDAQRLYEQIATSFEASLELMVADPAIALLINSVARDITVRLEKLEECTTELGRRLRLGEDQQEIYSTLQKINRGLATRFKDIRVETNRGARQVTIDRIYIPSKLNAKQETPTLKEILALELSSRKGRDRESHLEQETTRVTYNEFRSGFRRAVVLGDPGGGKSTLCQYLCYNLSKQYNLAQQVAAGGGKIEDDKLDPQHIRVPLRVVLRSFESARVTTSQLTIFDYIANDLRTVVNAIPLVQIHDFLRYVLTYGYAVLAFAGLDEILNTAARRDFVDLVTTFCNEFPLCPVFVTSRVVGYEDAPLPDDFEEFTLEKFDDKEVAQYVTKFLKVFSREKQAAAEEHAAVFMRQTEGTARDLRQNPLMLGLMTFLFVTKGDVPSNRPEIYKECAILMFEKWDQNRNIKADIPLGFDMIHLFGEIASEIYGNPILEEGVDNKWISRKNANYFMRVYEDRARAYDAAKRVTDFVTGRSWVMSEFGPDNYRFTHRTFMEYFFATYLDECHETVPELLAALLPHIKERQWDVISHLALQMKTFRNQKRTSQAIESLKAFVDGQSESLLEVANYFARAFSYLIPSEMDCKVAVLALAQAAFQIAALGETESATGIFRSLCTCAIERREYIQGVAGDVLEKCLRSTNDESSSSLSAMLLSDGGKIQFWGGAFTGIPLQQRVRESVHLNVKEDLRRRAIRDAAWANIYSEWYHDLFEELYPIHGIAMLLADNRPWPKNVSRPDLFVTLIAGVAKGFFAREARSIEKWAFRALCVIGERTDAAWVVSQRNSERRSRFGHRIWMRAIANAKGNLLALRGVLLLYRAFDDSINHRKAPETATRRGLEGADRELSTQISNLLEKTVPGQAAEMFAFWPNAKASG